ncbi:carboxypeptidase regulatory-like domain-containing protein [Thalassovita taeanensis]|uniref:Carboxypeptidase regulatory-like domain-containing protein n=1 Tax=Thalassovita taeanensis TaxID=657014 RepID=A0A1H9EE93_9RHOB|nr:carboxypeptidase regulatory-like domain-containing protein [Thalassovita taeanensis]SEQ23882.1 Carboxypeptidase regulatory-like domain-containing protein [Thalassovita taeanensis]
MFRMFRSFAALTSRLFLVEIILLIFFATLAAAAPVASGTRIVNIAITTYFNEALGITETVQSNQVEATVVAVPGIEVTGYSELWLSRGAQDQHYFSIENIGNIPIQARVAIDAAGEDGLLRRPRLIQDANGNGLEDAGEPELVADQMITLAMGQTMQLIYGFGVVSDAQAGKTATSVLRLSPVLANPSAAILGNLAASGIVRTVEGGFEINKSVARRKVAQGEELTYTLRLRNNSEADIAAYDSINGDALLIDGQASTGILVLDSVPLNTRFAAPRDAGGLDAVYHLRGTAPQHYTTRVPADLSSVDAVGFFWDGDYPVGQSSDLSFDVLLPQNLGDVTVRNIGWAYFMRAGETERAESNEVVLAYTSATEATLSFVDPSNRTTAAFGQLGTDTGLLVTAGGCNASNAIDSVQVTVWSLFTGDTEVVTATETGPNTGIFVSGPLPLTRMGTEVSGDGVIASDEGDTLQAMADCAGISLIADIPVNPGNFVFNSVTNAPVGNANVLLLSATGATVASATTDARGFFSLGSVPAGDYRLNVDPPEGFAFASVRKTFDTYNRSVVVGSAYGQTFSHPGGLFYRTDIPVDPAYGVPVALEKSADKASVMTSEPVVYTLTAHNNMDQALMAAQILDRPPFGAEMIAGSVTLDGQSWPDPTRDSDGDFLFDLGMLRPLETKVLTYVLRYSPAAREGRNYNTAVLSGRQAGTGQPRVSNSVSTYVKLDNSGGVFSREGTIIGSVFMDCNGNGLRDGAEEPGVPGVKIATQEGLIVVTDVDGKYSLFGLRPKSHVLGLTSRTLPEGTRAVATRTTDMRLGGTRLVDLKRGELRDEHFALEGCSAAVFDEIAARVEIFESRDDNSSLLLSDLPIQTSRPDTRSVRSEAGIATSSQIRSGSVAAKAAGATPAPGLEGKARSNSQTTEPLENLIRDLKPQIGFIGLPENGKIRRNTLTVRLKGPADLELALSLNGTEVSSSRIGERSVWARGNVQAMEFVAVKLRAGENTLIVTGKDQFGVERARHAVTLAAPGEPARIEIIAPKSAPASAGTIVPVVVRVLDGSGTPVLASGTVTLRANRAEWDVTDIRPDQVGLQAFIDNGEATFGLIAPQITGRDLIEVKSAFGSASHNIAFTADLDERIMVGVIEGAVALHGRGDLIENDRISPFEDTATGLRGEVYLKGRIKGDALLTLRYSSDRDTEDRLFRDIRGDEYYPVYGDNSERGFDAQSSSNLYVKVEKGSSYVLYGDIAIEPESDVFELGGYSRVATGAKAGWQSDRVSVTIFAAQTTDGQRVVEISGRGVSGPYDLDLTGFREGSDRVEILVRDRDTGDILSEQPQRRMTDYVLDYFRNALIFNSEVPQADRDGNPISIRVTYEATAESGDRYWLYGGEVNVQVNDNTRIGVRAVHADAQKMSDERERVHAAYVQARLNARTTLEVEAAQAENGEGQTGSAIRLLMIHEGKKSRLSIEAVHTGRYFAPTGSPTRPGTDRISLDYRLDMKNGTRLTAEADYIADRIAGSEILHAGVALEKQLGDHARTQVGLEIDHDLNDPDNIVVRARQGVDWTTASAPNLTFHLETRQVVSGSGESSLTLGMDHQISPRVALSGEAEFSIGDGTDELKRLRVGLDYQIAEWLEGRSEFITDDDARLIQGVRADWEVNEQLSLNMGLEHSQALDSDHDSLTSLSMGAKWNSKDESWIGQADLDQTFEKTGDTLYANLGVAGRISPDVTFLARNRYARDARGDGDVRVRHRARLGLSYRPSDDPRMAVLAWYEHRLDKGAARSVSHMWSVDGSYQASERLSLNAKYAGHYQRTGLAGGTTDATLTQLLQGGLTYDFADNRARLGLNAMRFWDDRGTATNAIGAELGLVLNKGSLLSIGYNKSSGRRPSDTTLYQEGVFLRIRLLLDDSLWGRLQGFGSD